MKTRALRTLLSSLICLALLATFSTSGAQAPDLRAAGSRVRPAVGEPDPSMTPGRSQLLLSGPLPPEGEVFETMELPAGIFSLPAGFAADVRASRDPKLDSAMAALAAAARVSLEEALDLARSQSLRLSGSRVHVQISVRAQGVDNAIRAVTRAGGEVTGIGNKNTLIQGWLPIDALEAVAAHDDVYLIRRPAEVVLLGDLHAPNATTEGLAVINGPAWHTAGHTGAGVKVGVIDGGFEGYTSLLGTDLPASVTVKNFVDGEDDSQVDGTTKHGTACAEIIHDIVPDATLYLAKTLTNVDLQEAAAWLKDTHQVDIISTSLGWYNLTPGDGTGEFADLVQDARNNGILWVTAAGNDREVHWGGAYSPSTSDPDVHAFDGSDWMENCLGSGAHDGSCYVIPAGYPLFAFLRWDDWTNVDQDFDLCLLGWTGSQWGLVTCSTDTQDGGPGQRPTEFIGVAAPAETAYAVGIVRSSATRNVHFELFMPKTPGLDWREAPRSLSNLADAPDAMTVAALDVTSPPSYPQESYSSEGPTNGPGGTAAGGFTKPDISGFANVSTESYGAGVFNGTSSATPHVAGAAALVLSAYPSYTAGQLQSFLEGRAVDMGSAGMDPLFGYGRLHLGDPPGAANTAPTISGLPDQVVPVSGSADNAIDLWAYASDAEDADADLTFDIINSPDPNAGVTVDSDRYIDINPTPGWTGVTDVEVQVEDTGGLTDADEFRVTVFSGKTWDGSVSVDWHDADNWTPAGVPTSGDDVLIPDVTNDPVISSGDATANSLVVSEGAVLDLTGRTLTVEGTLTNNGSLKQTQAAVGGSTTNFLRITNLAGTQTKYYGVDITPSGTADVAFDAVATLGAPHSRQVTLALASLPYVSSTAENTSFEGEELSMPAALLAPQAPVNLVLDDGSFDGALGVNDGTDGNQFIWLNRFTPSPADFPFQLEQISVVFGSAGVTVGGAVDLLVYEDTDGDGDPSDATLLSTYNETVLAADATTWSVYTLTLPLALNGPGDVLIGVINRYQPGAGGGLLDYPAGQDRTASQSRSWAGWWTTEPAPDPAILPPDASWGIIDALAPAYAGNWMVRGYGSTVVTNTAPTISGLPDQAVPINGSADNAIDLWAYASDAEDADSAMTYTIVNSPIVSAGVSIDSNRYIDINPATDWTGVTDVEVQVQDTGGLTDTDTFSVTVSDVPDIEVSPTSFEETLMVDQVYTATLTISNAGTDILVFWFDTVAVPWLSVDPPGAGIPAGGSQPVDVVFDATGQSLGDYTTDLVINSTDPDEDPVTVPITMHVSETSNTPPTISGLPDQQVPMNGSLHLVIDLWAYASDAEDADSVMTYTISNSPTISAGVAITINRYIDIDPAADWTGVTDVEVQVKDTGGLTDTDTFQVTVGDVPNIEVTPASLEETLDVDQVYTATLTISNTGTAILPFWFDTVAVPWLSVDPSAGAISAGGSQPVDVIFDATGQSLGDYTTDLVINSTDPDDDPVTVPVTMHVSGTLNTPPTMSGLPDQAVGMNDSIDNAIDLWAYASDAEDADADLTFDIINSPDPNAGVTVDSDRYIDINPATDWTGVTDVEVQVQDTGGLTDTDTFQVTVSGSLVSVTVYGNQLCSGRTSGVRRCFDVDTTAAMSATVRFYFSEAERNDNQLDNLVVLHYNGGWAKEPGPYTRGGTGDAQYVEAQNVDDFSLFALDTGANAVYMPILLKRWPPTPDTPVLNAISNSDNDGNYTVSWQAALLAETYILQEDDNSSFSSPTQVYEGSSTSRSITGHSAGTFYYRVKAINDWEGIQLESGWSNVRSVKISPPTRFYPSNDTAVLQGAPTSSYGSLSTMLVGYAHRGCLGWDGKVARSLVKFDLSDIPAGTSISEARLYLNLVGTCYYTGHTQPRTVTLYRNTSNWTSSATWNTRPSVAGTCGSASVSVTALGYKSFNVTNVVRNWINGTQPNYGFTVVGPESSGSEFALLEFATMNASGTSYDPYLQITYTGMAHSKEGELAVEVIPEPVPCGPGFQDVFGTFLGHLDYSASGFVQQTACFSK